jgi:hypothetical protein
MTKSILVILLCGAPPAHAEDFINFQCADGAKLSVIFEDADNVLVMVGGGALRLQNRHPSSGQAFASPYGGIRIVCAKARFSLAGGAATECRRAQ